MTVRKTLVCLAVTALMLVPVRVTPAQNAGEQKTSGVGLCAKCALHITAQCQNALVVDTNGRRQVYFLRENSISKKFHENVCKTSVPIVVVGRVIKGSSPGADATVVVGEIEPSSLALDNCEIPAVVSMGGIGQCAKCSLNASTACRNVITCHLDGKDVTFWLTDNEVPKAFHQTICKGKEPIVATGKQEGKDPTGHEIFTPVKLERISLQPVVNPPGVEGEPVAVPVQKAQFVMGKVWCERCFGHRGRDCQIVIEFTDDAKRLNYWLIDNETKTKIHDALYDGQSPARWAFMKVTGIVIQPAAQDVGGLFSATKFERVQN